MLKEDTHSPDFEPVHEPDNEPHNESDHQPDHEPGSPVFSVCVLASGSRGNSIYISDGSTSVLVDAGLSGVELERRMESRGIDPKSLDAVIVTHEHTDHIHGVGVLSRRYELPVYITEPTYEASESKTGALHEVKIIQCGTGFSINELDIQPFTVSHDAADTAGFTVKKNGTGIGIATDLGIATALVRHHLKNCTALIIESNHDPAMLEHGPYPWALKQRVKSRTGHLSNEDARNLIHDIKHDGLTHLILGHLSEKNNTPEIARRTVGQAVENMRTELFLALQHEASDLFRIA